MRFEEKQMTMALASTIEIAEWTLFHAKDIIMLRANIKLITPRDAV